MEGWVIAAGVTLVGLGVVLFVLRTWMETENTRLLAEVKTALREGEASRPDLLDVRQKACLDALEVVDAIYSNRDWYDNRTDPPTPLPVTRQKLDIVKVRTTHSSLVLLCSVRVVEAFISCAIGPPPGTPDKAATAAGLLAELQRAIRAELGNTSPWEPDSDRTWIARIPGDSPQ